MDMLIKDWLQVFLERFFYSDKKILEDLRSLDSYIQELILRNSKIAFYVLDMDQMKFIDISDSLKYFFNINDGLSNCSLNKLILNEDYEYVVRAFINQGYSEIAQVSYRAVDHLKSVRWVSDIGIKVRGSKVDKRIGLLKDESELNITKTSLDYLSSKDPVTNFLNAYAFNDRLLVIISKSQMQNFALIKLEIQNYNSIRNHIGYHNIGLFDKKISENLENIFERRSIFGRLEAHVFCVIMHLENGDVEKQIFERCALVQKLNFSEIFINEYILKLNIVIGVSLYPTQGDDSQELIKKTDIAVNFLKNNNEGKIAIYNEGMDSNKALKYMIETQLLNAMNNDELFLEFQPVVDNLSGEISAVEVSIKWNHSSLGIISLKNIDDTTEETGKIKRLSKWLFKKTCQMRAAWIDKIPPKTIFSIKMPSFQFDEQYVEFIHQCLIESNISSSLIEIEISEEQLVDNHKKVSSILRAIAKMGIGIVIDDFGEKYSSFFIFKILNITKVKIHESLTCGIEEEYFIYNDAMIKSLSEFCKKMNIKMIAKGIELEKHISSIKHYDIDAFQGGYFYHPVSSDLLLNIFNQLNEVSNDFKKTS